MDPASEILENPADGLPEPSMGSEYLAASSYLARPGAKVATAPPHGSNDSDFGLERLRHDGSA